MFLWVEKIDTFEWSRGNVVGIVTCLQDDWGSDPGGRNGMFLFLKTLGAPPSFSGHQIFFIQC